MKQPSHDASPADYPRFRSVRPLREYTNPDVVGQHCPRVVADCLGSPVAGRCRVRSGSRTSRSACSKFDLPTPFSLTITALDVSGLISNRRKFFTRTRTG